MFCKVIWQLRFTYVYITVTYLRMKNLGGTVIQNTRSSSVKNSSLDMVTSTLMLIGNNQKSCIVSVHNNKFYLMIKTTQLISPSSHFFEIYVEITTVTTFLSSRFPQLKSSCFGVTNVFTYRIMFREQTDFAKQLMIFETLIKRYKHVLWP